MKPPKRLFRRDPRRQVPADPMAPLHAPLLPDAVPEIPGFDKSAHVVMVPTHSGIKLDVDVGLRALEAFGIRVDRSKGSAIDVTRNVKATMALQGGFDSFLFIDDDVMFDPVDALSLLLSDEPVICGIYAAKLLGTGRMNVDFGPETGDVGFGPDAGGIYPAHKVPGGFLRIKCDVLEEMIDGMGLPLCAMADTEAYPFFMPTIVQERDATVYLAEDYAFSWRCHKIGITPKVDTRIRLYHLGDYPFALEEALGAHVPRQLNTTVNFQDPRLKR